MRLATTVLKSVCTLKALDGRPIDHFSIFCTKFLLFSTNICNRDLKRSEMCNYLFYEGRYCVYCMLAVKYNRALHTKSSGAVVRGIEAVKMMQKNPFLFCTVSNRNRFLTYCNG